MIQPNYSAFQSTKTVKSQSKVRVEVEFLDVEEVKKPISVFAKSFITNREFSGGKTTVKSKVAFTLVYLSDDGYKKANSECEATCEFDGDVCLVESLTADVKLVNSNGLVGVASVIFIGEKRESCQVSVLQPSDGIISKNKEIGVDLYYNEKCGEQVITDEFSLDFTVGEVLSYSACAYVTDLRCGLGKIILEGETVLTVKALPFSENNDIVKETRVIPYRYELEADDALPDMKGYAKVCVASTNVKIVADENKQRSFVTADIKLAFSGVLVGEEKFSVVEDAYLKTHESLLKIENVETLCFKEQKHVRKKIICQGEPSIEDGRILAVFGESVNVISVKTENGFISVDGTVRADVVFKNSDNGIVCVPCESPFSFDLSEDDIVSGLSVVLGGVSARVRNGEIELEVHLETSYNLYYIQRNNLVLEIEEKGERNRLGSAISVFVATRGDDLWDVAKRLGSDEEEILKYNSDLTFPLDGDERVILYRQKL